MLFSFLVIMKLVQYSMVLPALVLKRNFWWVVPVIILEEVPIAVAILMVVGCVSSCSFAASFWSKRLLEAPVSTRYVIGSAVGGMVMVMKKIFLPMLALNSFIILVFSVLACFMYWMVEFRNSSSGEFVAGLMSFVVSVHRISGWSLVRSW